MHSLADQFLQRIV